MGKTIRNPREHGYNLVELLVAMALLATVLMSILTLFVWGRRNVYSGKQLTRATSVTTHVLEDLQPLSVTNLNREFLIDSGTSMVNTTVAGVAYTGVIIRSTADTSQENTTVPAAQYLTRWATLISADDSTKFYKPRVTIVIKPDELKTAGDPTSAAVVRVRVVTEWTEGESRARNVTADVVKFNREN